MEVALRNQPPYLDNPAVIGPTHSPVLDAMTTLEERERIEADYEWFRYSKFALPFLIFNLLTATTLLLMSMWWGGLNLKKIHPGIPRNLEIPTKTDDTEGGVPKYNRNVRISSFIIGFFGLIGITLTMYLKPPASIRKAAYFFFAFVGLFVGGVLGAVAGGLDAGNIRDAVWCRSRERGTVPLPDNCYPMDKMLVALTVVDLMFCVVAILTAIVLCLAAAKSFQAPAEGDEYVTPQTRGVSRTTRECLLLLLFLNLLLLVLMVVFTIIIQEGRDQRFADEVHYVRRYDNPEPGWPKKNTRLRLSASTVVILTVLINLIPFRSRVLAYILAFIYFIDIPLLVVVFAMDVKEIDTARHLVCPPNWSCKYHPFVTTAWLDIFLATLLLLYVIFEFVARLLLECRHCSRQFGLFELRKHEGSECASRPVRCEVCSKTLKAKNFVYKHRFDCGHDNRRCDQCGEQVLEWAYKEHQQQCPKWPVRCTMCDNAYAREDLPSHTANCENQPASCEACGETFRASEMARHQATCSEVVVPCERCGQQLPRFRLADHSC